MQEFEILRVELVDNINSFRLGIEVDWLFLAGYLLLRVGGLPLRLT